MSMQPRPWPDVPERTARIARAASRRGNLAMRQIATTVVHERIVRTVNTADA